jgi:hypothetical protein
MTPRQVLYHASIRAEPSIIREWSRPRDVFVCRVVNDLRRLDDAIRSMFIVENSRDTMWESVVGLSFADVATKSPASKFHR